MAFSPPPPPQAARAFVRQLFASGGGKPVVVVTLLDDPDSLAASLEFLNEGGPASGVECLAQVVGRIQHVAVGGLATGAAESVALGPLAEGDFRCVWACSDAKGRKYIWSYDGQHRRLRRGSPAALQDVFDEMYPAPGT
jgi:hypothetical protein